MTSTVPSATAGATAQSEIDYHRQLRRVVISSFLGSSLEYYDFLLYATMSGLVFNKVFFSGLDPVTGTIASFGTVAIGYFARPVGGIVFGHFGDKIGRKRMLFIALSMMGLASALIGVLPTSAQIGGFAAVLLILLRLVQGLALGGEWGGSVLMTAEHARSRRGFWASFTPAGGPLGALLATGAIAIVSGSMSNADFIAWGWRIPFLASILLVIIGLIVRYQIKESPIFEQEVEVEGSRSRVPAFEVLRHHWRQFLLGIGFTLAQFVGTVVITAFVIAYAVQLGFPQQGVVSAVAIAAAFSLVFFLVWGAVSDKIGRRPTLIAGAVLTGIFGFALFAATSSGSVFWLTVALVFGNAIAIGAMSAPTASAVAELFPTEVRYSGSSMVFQISGAIGGLAPLVFVAILAGNGGNTLPISLIIAATCALVIVSALLMRETKGEVMGRRVDDAGAPGPASPLTSSAPSAVPVSPSTPSEQITS